MPNTRSLQGRTALITGASSGIGAAIAVKFALEGCALGILGRDEKELKRLAVRLRKRFKVRTEVYRCDITKAEQIVATAKQVKKDFGKIDILVNNAGGSSVTLDSDVFDTAFDRDLDVNLRGTHLSSRLLSDLIKKDGAIVNISSLSGQTVLYPAFGKNSLKMGYAVAKAGVIQLTRAYAIALADRRVRVNAVAPGAVYPTGMTQEWNKEKQRTVAANIPLQRLGTPEDVASAVYFLVSDASSFITGQTLSVNGGRYMS